MVFDPEIYCIFVFQITKQIFRDGFVFTIFGPEIYQFDTFYIIFLTIEF